jgi:DNA-binding response OmpR family regulator
MGSMMNTKDETGNNNHNSHNKPAAEQETNNEKILLVDDDTGILRMLTLTLQRSGYTVSTAENGLDALSKADSFKPDLIILDVMMPGMDGLEVCQRLRNNSHLAHIPILMLSARSRDIDKAAGFQVGADDYLEKPVGVKALLARVEGLLLRARYMPQQHGSIIAIMGAKGGVGTTSLAVNLGAALVARQKKVIISEMRETRGTLHHFLNLTAQQNLGSLLSMESTELSAREVSRRLVRYAPGFNLLLAPPGHNTLSLTADHVETLIHHLSSKSDYLLLDLPTPPLPNIGPALENADHIFLVTEPEPISLKCTMTTLKMLAEWGLTNQVRVVIVTRSPAAALTTKNEIEQQLGGVPLVATIPPAVEMLQDAIRMGKPLLELKPESLPAQAYTNLAAWLLGQQQTVGQGQPVAVPA